MSKPLPATLLVLVIAAAIAVPYIPMTAGTGTPHAIYGVLRDAAGNGVSGASVFINNTRTLESLNSQTTAGGSFSVDISNYPMGYMDGDQISFLASYGLFKAYGNISVVVGESAQYINLALACTSHIVKGYVDREDGAYALNHLVNITEVARGGTISKLVDVFEMYSIEMAFLPGGYAAGDQMVVSCEEDGYEGTATLPISSNQVQWVNLTMLDVRPPVIVHTVTSGALVNQAVAIAANITDNAPFTAVLRYIGVEGGFYEELTMTPDNGGASDWDGSGAATVGVYGARIPAQEMPGEVRYYIEARDAHFTVTSPSSNPAVSPHLIQVRDVGPPFVTAGYWSSLEAGYPITTFEAYLSDNVGVTSAWVNWTGPGYPILQTTPLFYTGVGYAWSGSLPAFHALGYLNITTYAADASGNVGDDSTSIYHLVPIVDTTSPSGDHVRINSMVVGIPANVTLAVTDNLAAGSATLWVKGPVGYPSYVGINAAEGPSGYFSAQIPAQASVGILKYYWTFNDTTGNSAQLPLGGGTFPYEVLVVDAGTPFILHEPIASAPVREPIEVRAFVSDNVSLSNVTLSYTAVGEATYTIVDMSQEDGGAAGGNFSATIPAPQSLGEIRYFINASDSAGNYLRHPSVWDYNQISVVDITPPKILEDTFVPSVGGNRAAEIGCLVTEDVDIDWVKLWYTEIGTGEWSSLNMTYDGALANGTGRYSAGTAGSLVGEDAEGIGYYFSAIDSSHNLASLPEANQTSSPFTLIFPDVSAPVISHQEQATAPLNKSLDISANITDDEGVEWAILTYKIGANASVAIQMTKKNETCFAAEIPPVLRSVNATYRISAGDGHSASLSPEYSLAYVNAPPTVNSTTPDTWPVGEDIFVSAMADDDVGARAVALMHRLAGGTTFTQLAMTKGLLGYWSAELPPFEGLGTLEYYFAAEDDEVVGFSPEGAPAEYLIVEALDSVAPAITHNAAETYRAGHKPIIVAIVTDDIAVDSVEIHYRNGGTNFTEQAMELAQASTNGSFVVQLPAVEAGTLEYYFTASDGTNEARLPSVDGEYYTVVVESRPTDYVPYAVVIVVVLLTVIGLLMAYRAMRRQRSEKPPK